MSTLIQPSFHKKQKQKTNILSNPSSLTVVSCLVDLRPHIVEVLEGMLPPLDEDMRDEMTSISSPTPCTASFIDIDEVPIITSQNAASTSLFIHDPYARKKPNFWYPRNKKNTKYAIWGRQEHQFLFFLNPLRTRGDIYVHATT